MPDLIRLYIRSSAIGFALGAVFTAGLIGFDVMGIGHLILGSDIGLVAAGMLVFFNGIIFAAVQFAYQVMAMAEDDDGPVNGLRDPVLVPIPVESRRRPRR
jgi:hypothetical protein